MLHLQTILKWLLPSVKFTCKMLAVSGEVFCRHSFGQRYAATLLASFFFSLAILMLQRVTALDNNPTPVDAYLLTFFVLVLCHIGRMWRPRTAIHSYSNGQSWSFWERLRIKPILVRMFAEPIALIYIGMLFRSYNDFLSAWIQAAGLCLSGKEIIDYWHHGNRVLDSVDARLEGERLGSDVRQHSTPQASGGQRNRPMVTVEPGQPLDTSVQQSYSRLDPALQQLLAANQQPRPNVSPANRPANRQNARRHHAGPLGTSPRLTYKRPQ